MERGGGQGGPQLGKVLRPYTRWLMGVKMVVDLRDPRPPEAWPQINVLGQQFPHQAFLPLRNPRCMTFLSRLRRRRPVLGPSWASLRPIEYADFFNTATFILPVKNKVF